MKKLLLSAFALVALVATVFTASTIIKASTEESQTFVSFITDETTTPPVDPEDPDNPGTETGTGAAGPLSIDHVPSLDFGEQVLSGNIETYKSTNTKPFVQVTDKRGTGAGYTLKAELSEFVKSDDATKVLPAKIDFTSTDLATTSTNTSSAPTAPTSFTLDSTGNAVTVLSAGTDQGMGTWIERWLSSNTENEKVELTVNTVNAYKASYEGKITWALEITP